MKLPKAFLILLIPIVMLISSLSSSLGCNLIVKRLTFDCRIIQPAALIFSVIVLVTGIIIVKNLYKLEKLFFNKIIVLIYIISILLPASMLILYNSSNKEQKNIYFEGITLEACATGKPSVPWGKSIGQTACYTYFGKCDEITDDAYPCIQRHLEYYSEYENCDSLKVSKNYCMLEIAKKKQDINFCKSYSAPRDKWICLGTLVDPGTKIVGSVNQFATPTTEKLERCKNLNGSQTQKDYCFESIVMSGSFYNPQERTAVCNMISDSFTWIKEDCAATTQ